MYDHLYRLSIAWQNVGYNQPPHLGYYLPDATAARFTVENEEQTDEGFALTVHYVNCTGATLNNVILPDGTKKTASAAGFSLTKDTKNCNVVINGQPSQTGTWQFILKATSPANGIATTDTISVEVGEITGIDEIVQSSMTNIQSSTVFDLQGRKVNATNMRGIYIKNGKKYVIN